LLLGVVAAFLGCCLAGRLASRRNHVDQFQRYHAFTSPQTLYYPPARAVRALARSRLDPNKVVVVVGGNSIMQGFSQAPDEVWTRRLQEQLGDEYQVLNLALPGCTVVEFGTTA